MDNKTAKHYSEAKLSRIDRKYLVGYHRYHKNCVKRFNRSDRRSTKNALKHLIG